MRPVSDAQVRRLMEEMSKDGQIGRAAMKADMDRKTARKYVTAAKLPSEMKQPRTWRTRPGSVRGGLAGGDGDAGDDARLCRR